MTSNVQVMDRQQQEPVPIRQAVTPMEMLAQAIDKGQSAELITKLMDLSERWQATQARRAFDQAISLAKKAMPIVAHNAEGHNKKTYANFAAIAEAIAPALAEHGLSYRFRTKQDDRISVTCVISHCDGHSEENTLSAMADPSGNKNAIQALGSTLTYLQRYSLVQALGIAAAQDDDGKATGEAPGELISDEQYEELSGLLTEKRLPIFLEYYKIKTLSDLPASKFLRAKAAIEKKQPTTTEAK